MSASSSSANPYAAFDRAKSRKSLRGGSGVGMSHSNLLPFGETE
jgi:hypothetical protein